jgi:hypothetical protein
MKRSLKNMTGYSIEAVDGPKGKVKDFLFDEESWGIRYLDADYGNLFQNKRVLIPSVFLKKPDWDRELIPIQLSKKEIEDCPPLEERKPVSREYEKELSKHYKIEHYWPYYYAPTGAVYFPPRPLSPPLKIIDEKDIDTNLRSFHEVKGYHIKATDDKMGHVHDLIVDDEDLQIVYVIVDTSNWLPWSKKVLLAIDWLEDISYVDREVTIGLATDTMEEAPEFDLDRLHNQDYEKELYEFYHKSLVR